MGSEKNILIYLSHCLHKLLQFQTSAMVRPVPLTPPPLPPPPARGPSELALDWLVGRGAVMGLGQVWRLWVHLSLSQVQLAPKSMGLC